MSKETEVGALKELVRDANRPITAADRHAILNLIEGLERSAVNTQAVAKPPLPRAVIDALRFYAHGHHYNIDADHQQFDTVSGEPQNWLFSERDGDCSMVEDGGVAKAALLGELSDFEEPPGPIEGEVFVVAASGGDQDQEVGS